MRWAIKAVLFCLSARWPCTRRICKRTRAPACLCVTEPGASGDPLGASRVTLIGTVSRIPEPELAAVRTVYLTRFPDSKYWVDFDDFFFYRMDVLDVYYVGGFGVMGWVAASEYSQAQSDPLAEHNS